jgi:hypothetical protein
LSDFSEYDFSDLSGDGGRSADFSEAEEVELREELAASR